MRRAPRRAELTGALAFIGAVAFAVAYWRTGEGPYIGTACALLAVAFLFARPMRD